MSHASPDGRWIASLDASGPALVLCDARGREQRRLGLGSMEGIAGFRWLRSSMGLAVWNLDTVIVLGIGEDEPPKLAYAIEQPEGIPLGIEDVRAIDDGVLVLAQACDRKRVQRRATVVHLELTETVGRTSLQPWSGMLYAATALHDGSIVLALNEPEHFDAALLSCAADEVASPDSGVPSLHSIAKICGYVTQHWRFFASEFRVVRVHGPGVVEVVGRHRCPHRGGCVAENWAVANEELVWSDRWALHRLRAPIAQDPLWLGTTGSWMDWPGDWTGSLWVRGDRILAQSLEKIFVLNLDGEPQLEWRSPSSTVVAARFTPDGARAIVVLPTQLVELDLGTGHARLRIERLDVPAAFAARYERIHFSDAALNEAGTLAFDVVAEHRPSRSAFKTLVPGMWHPGCEASPDPTVAPRTSSYDLVDDPVTHLRRVGHLVRARR